MSPNPNDIHIESGRLSIKPFSESDADATFPCITHSLTRLMAWEPPANREGFDRIWQAWLLAIAEGTDFVFAIRQRDSGAFLGLVGLHHVKSACAELGIWIREDRHREGIGREAVTLAAAWATRELGIERFTYSVAEENYPSRRIAESLGGIVVERCETPKYKAIIYQINSTNHHAPNPQTTAPAPKSPIRSRRLETSGSHPPPAEAAGSDKTHGRSATAGFQAAPGPQSSSHS